MPEEDVVETQDGSSEFSESLGGNIGDDSPAPTPEVETSFDWNTVNLETVDLNTVPDAHRSVAEAGQRRIREMRSGVDSRVRELDGQKEKFDAWERQQREAQAAPKTIDDTATAMGYDLSQATTQQRESVTVVSNMIENHPIVAGLRAELDALKQSSGVATDFVQKEQDVAYENEYASAVATHGQENVDRLLDHAGLLLGQPKPGGGTFGLSESIGLMMGKTVAEANAVDAAASAALNGAQAVAGGIPTVAEAPAGNMTDAEEDAWFAKHF